jgi:type VI secretion system protein ImpF
MATPTRKPRVIPSLLDRLLGHGQPPGTDDPATSRSADYTLRDLEVDLLRDLRHLLNTRCANVVWPDDLPVLNRSLLAYGRPDFGVISLDEVSQFPARIQQIIEEFEPRCQDVTVEMLSRPTTVDRSIELRVEMTLKAELAAERFVFTSKYQPTTGAFDLQSETDA